MSDDDLVRVLGESILGAHRVLREGKPQAALDMIDIVLGALPPAGLEAVEIAALPPKIIALARLGRPADAGAVLARLEGLAAAHGTANDQLACTMLREQIAAPELTARARAAMEAIQAGNPDGVRDLEIIAGEAERSGQHVLALGSLTLLGKVYAAVDKPELARDRLTRARQLLDAHPLDGDRQATAVAEIDRLLAEI